MASSSSSCSHSCNNDVFLSFRGEDTRKTFVDHLYSALVHRKISTYKDDETLPRGESIRPALFKAIKASQIAVIIFSKNYADSSWCLDEVAYIIKCKDKRGLTVMPVFYDVAPSEIRKQEGEFGKGFAKQEGRNNNKVESWRKALVDACDISGWEPKNIANGHEAKVIKEISDTISEKLFSLNSGVDEDLVGMSARLQELEAQLDIGTQDVRMVGVWGVGGSGKTTLASSLYRKISRHFQGDCFIENIREKSTTHRLETLQEHILSRLSNTQTNLYSVQVGKGMIRSRLNRSKVLICLDDVDDRNQLDALAGSHNWFGSGSRIIITTRDENLLTAHRVDLVCRVTLLSHEEAVMLFNKHAYNKENPLDDYETLSSHVVSYAAGLPLAVKVLGSFLYDKDEKEWMSSMARLKDIPETGIIEKLKISYDGLKTVEKELFLDIACFFRHQTTDYPMEVLEACGYHPKIGIKVLTQKALITIENGKFDMHDLVQEMGHYIARREHPDDPSKHSRVWKRKDLETLCLSAATMENDEIQAIQCNIIDTPDFSLFYKNVSNMKKLRYLYVHSFPTVDKNEEGPTFLSNELRCINLKYYPRSPFPDTFKAVKLVVLELSHSSQTELWKGYQHLPCLKVLELSFLENLLNTPDFDGLPSLQKLKLVRCKSLTKIHPSLGKHTSIEHVSVNHCESLTMFPTIIHMRKLNTLEIISSHRRLDFPEIKSNMESLVKLSLEGIGIDVLLLSVAGRCANLISLHLSHCWYSLSTEVNLYTLKDLEEFVLYSLIFSYIRLPFVLSQLPYNLRKLNLSYCGLKDGDIPSGIGEMSNLEELDLTFNKFTRLDFSLSQLTRLKILKISYTRLSMVEFPKLPSSLIVLSANEWSTSLTTIGDSFKYCKWLCDVSIKEVRITSGCSNILESMLQGKAIENHYTRLLLEGIEIAKEFIPPLVRRGCRLELTKNWCNDFSGFLMCAVVSNCLKDLNYVTMKQVISGLKSEDDVVTEESGMKSGDDVVSEESGMQSGDDVVSEESGMHSDEEDGEEEVVWKESDNDRNRTLVWYVSFASLRHTKWWNSIDKAVPVSFQITPYALCNGFGVRMVARKNRSDPIDTSTTQEEPKFSRYTPEIHIYADSKNLLEFRLRTWHDY